MSSRKNAGPQQWLFVVTKSKLEEKVIDLLEYFESVISYYAILFQHLMLRSPILGVCSISFHFHTRHTSSWARGLSNTYSAS